MIQMMKILISVLMITQISSFETNQSINERYKLQRVLIFSRHNIRTPIMDDINEITPNIWPSWNEKSGYLTPKGAVMEGYMGEFFAHWLRKQKVLSNACPTRHELLIYANVKQRTVESAKAFAEKGFPGCDIKVHHKDRLTTDAVFNPVIHNGTKEFQEVAFKDMEEILATVNVKSLFEKLNDILNVKESVKCKNYNQCDLANDKTIIEPVVKGKRPTIKGPLKISNTVVDSFIMEYYDGRPLDQVAWGKIANTEELGKFIEITKQYHSVIFNTTMIARDIALPLVKCIRDIFKNKSDYPTVTLLMGHDANMMTLLKSLNVIPKALPGQIENTPVGSKIVFQKWLDTVTGSYHLQINFVYLTPKQIRNGGKITIDNRPKNVTLELSDCRIDANDLCPWDDFMSLLDKLVA